ncbi:MAG: 50S ribosomal protein L4 [Nanoarchaeota archaeon]|nr:50S ribosomal protein L4 [Nanoarchaeota archaeon]
MKAALYDQLGKKKSDIELPSVFSTPIREDIVVKSFEAEKFLDRQVYANYEEAGKRHSASGTISHRRHEWKGHYGKGIARLPRKTMWRRGTQFYWVGAETSQTRGGRMAHPPKASFAFRKINKKERNLALNIAFTSTFNKELVKKHYASLDTGFSASVIESLPVRTKDLLSSLKNIFGTAFSVVMKKKSVRSGKGKARGRRYKSNSGLLIVSGNSESNKFTGVEIKSVSELKLRDLYPLGRLTLYTKKALEEISNKENKE